MKEKSIGRIKTFFISDAKWGIGQLGEQNGTRRVSQMKPALKSEAPLCFLREKAFAAAANAFPIRLYSVHEPALHRGFTVCSRLLAAQIY